MPRYFIDGAEVGALEAHEHWVRSETYACANKTTRDWIWNIATLGDDKGNKNQSGELNHLAEAGIEIKS